MYSFEKTIRSYLSIPNFKSISFKMAVLQEGGQNLPSTCVCYPKDPMWNRVNLNRPGFLQIGIAGGELCNFCLDGSVDLKFRM